MDAVTDETLLGPRVETYWVELLDRDDQVQGVLDTVEMGSGSVEVNMDATIHGGCTLKVHEELDWLTARLRPWVRVNDAAWPLGVFLTSSPTYEHSSTGGHWSVGGLDKMVILDEWKADESFVVDAGTPVIPKVVELINSIDETSITATDSPKVTKYSHTWLPGTSMIRIVNDLLLSIGYQGIWVDGFGYYRLEPYVSPENRTIRRVFQAGEAAIHSSSWTREQDIAGVPNKVVAVTTGTGPEPGMHAVAENTDPNNPYSYQARGNRWVVKHYEGVEAVDQESLDSIADRYLWGASAPRAHLKVKHAAVPLDTGDAVLFRSGTTSVRATVNEYKINLKSGSLVEGLWTEVGRE